MADFYSGLTAIVLPVLVALPPDGDRVAFGDEPSTLSAEDDAFYLTERRLLDEFADDESLMRSLDDFSGILADWRERSVLYA